MVPRRAERNELMRAEARARILEAAMRLFAERSFRGTTMEAVAREAGVSKGLAYHYFSGKQQILETLLEERVLGYLDRRDERKLRKRPTALSKLQLIVHEALEHAAEHVQEYRLYIAVLLQPAASGALVRVKTRHAERLAAYQARLEGLLAEVGVRDPARESIYLNSCLNGLILSLLVAPAAFPVKAMGERLLEAYRPVERRD
jgi:AcrR family transcriptional regulator